MAASLVVLNDELDILDCPVCYERLVPPVDVCENGHGICKRCRKSLTICGICRSKFMGNSIVLLNKLMENISIRCKYGSEGCDKSLSLKAAEGHEKFCCYRKEEKCLCIGCENKFFWEDINGHMKICEKITAKRERRFFTTQSINVGLNRKHHKLFFTVFISDIRTYFILRVIRNREKLFFCVQYMGEDQENAKNYKYDLKIDQGMPAPNKSYFSTSGLCVPYVSSSEETQEQEGVIQLHLESIFLQKDYLLFWKFTMDVKIYRLSENRKHRSTD